MLCARKMHMIREPHGMNVTSLRWSQFTTADTGVTVVRVDTWDDAEGPGQTSYEVRVSFGATPPDDARFVSSCEAVVESVEQVHENSQARAEMSSGRLPDTRKLSMHRR